MKEKTQETISVILPIHELTEITIDLFKKSLTSEQRIKLIKRNNPELLRDLIDNN